MTTRVTYTTGAADSDRDRRFEEALANVRETDAPLSPHIVGGEQFTTSERFDWITPIDGEQVVGRASRATGEVVDRAVKAAHDAQPDWDGVGWRERVAQLQQLPARIRERHLEVAACVTAETGKTRGEAIAEVQEGADLIDTYCGYLLRAHGCVTEMGRLVENEANTSVLRPYGVFGILAPFNFPFALSINMCTAALLMGNAVVYKPSDKAPRTGGIVADLLAASAPLGVVNVVHGGPEVGKQVTHAQVDGVAFTGSASVGREIQAVLARGAYPRPTVAELGGKNVVVVGSSASVEAAAAGTARSAFGFSGQKCSSCSRAVVVADVYDEFVERLARAAEDLMVGDPMESSSDLGPVIDDRSVRRFERAAALAASEGRICTGGRVLERPGRYVEPTVIADLPRGLWIDREEQFVPIVTVARADSFADALSEANAVDYGLTAGLFTADDDERARFLREIEAGVLYVNRAAGATTGAWPGVQAFCGWKASGTTGKGGLGRYYIEQFGREQSRTIVT